MALQDAGEGMKQVLAAAFFLTAGAVLIASGVWAPKLIFQTLSSGELIFAGSIAALAGAAEIARILRAARRANEAAVGAVVRAR
jgi:hypothetical protein